MAHNIITTEKQRFELDKELNKALDVCIKTLDEYFDNISYELEVVDIPCNVELKKIYFSVRVSNDNVDFGLASEYFELDELECGNLYLSIMSVLSNCRSSILGYIHFHK